MTDEEDGHKPVCYKAGANVWIFGIKITESGNKIFDPRGLLVSGLESKEQSVEHYLRDAIKDRQGDEIDRLASKLGVSAKQILKALDEIEED